MTTNKRLKTTQIHHLTVWKSGVQVGQWGRVPPGGPRREIWDKNQEASDSV